MSDAPPPKRPGRKPLPDGAGRTARIELRVRPAVKAAWEARAAAAGLSLRGWVEQMLGPQGGAASSGRQRR